MEDVGIQRSVRTASRGRALAALACALACAPVLGACMAERPDDNGLLAPPPEGRGYQYVMEMTLPAGTEAEYCKFVFAPIEGMYINRDEVRFTAGGHHFRVYETAYTFIPTAKDDGTPVNPFDVFDCSDGVTNGWSVTRMLGGSQNGAVEGDSAVALPPGVAIPVAPGRVLIMNGHFINASDHALDGEVRINFHTLAEQEVEEFGDLLFLYNPYIKVPAGGSSRARMRCPVYHDITIVNAQSHMHDRAVGYAARVAGQEPFYTSDRSGDVPVKSFADQGGIQVPEGSILDYYCDYQNPELRDVYEGARSTDEMCMLIGSYYPANPAIANCLDESGMFFAGEVVGEGRATCAESMKCVDSALNAAEMRQALTSCVVGAAPEVSRELADVVNCMTRSPQPAVDCAPYRGVCELL
jgi:hypothetical protein